MKPKTVYLLLCLAGIVLPYSQLVPWLHHSDPNRLPFFEELFANRISTFFGAGVFVSALVVFALARYERGSLGSRRWLPVVAVQVCGVSLGLPLLLYLREGSGEAARAASA